MGELLLAFAGRTLLFQYASEAAGRYLELLFGDLQDNDSGIPFAIVLEIAANNDPAGRFTLRENGRFHFEGALDVAFAAVLFDRVIFHLLAGNANGVALHAGAVGRDHQVILLPGQSGAGKSTLAAWLTAAGFSYFTDELVFLPAAGDMIHCFTRPFNIKPGAIEVIRHCITAEAWSGLLVDSHGAIIPHRLVNPQFLVETGLPVLLLFPVYQAGAEMRLERLSPPKAGLSLVACNVNGRNLADHGFGQLMDVARSIPAYRLTYGSVKGLREEVCSLLRTLWP